MELSCLLSMYLVLAPVGVVSKIQRITVMGTCSVSELTVVIKDPGVLHIISDYREYKIKLPVRLDQTWLTYRLGEQEAWIGNCSPYFHPFNDMFCVSIMTRISGIGWQ